MAELVLMDQPVTDYFVTHISKFEIVEGSLIRIYCYKQLGHVFELQYTVMIPISRLAEMGRLCLQMASSNYNEVVSDKPEVVH